MTGSRKKKNGREKVKGKEADLLPLLLLPGPDYFTKSISR